MGGHAGRRIITLLSLSVNGFFKVTKDVLPLEGNDSIFYSIAVPVLLAFPIAAASVAMIVDAGYTWSSDLHVLLTPGIGFLVVFRCTSAFNRFWEARGHISKAIKGCRTLSVIVITQYHRHANKSGDDIPKAVDDVRRYLIVYFHTMINQLRETRSRRTSRTSSPSRRWTCCSGGAPGRQSRRSSGSARGSRTWSRWATSRRCSFTRPASRSTLLIESFNGLTKIKSTPIPFPIRRLCSLLTVIYVYSAPLALATAFRGFTEYWNIMGRTVGGSVRHRTPDHPSRHLPAIRTIFLFPPGTARARLLRHQPDGGRARGSARERRQ